MTDPWLIAEVDRCVEAIRAFQEARGRKVHTFFRRWKRERHYIDGLVALGYEPTPQLRALYTYYDGLDTGNRINQWASNVFLQFDWQPVKMILSLAELCKRINPGIMDGSIPFVGASPSFARPYVTLRLFPNRPDETREWLHATLYPISEKSYVMFDGVVPMLQSVVLAQEAGLISYVTEQAANIWSVNEKGEPCRRDDQDDIRYDPAAFWELTKHLNPNSNYWMALISGILDFDVQ